VNTSLMVHTKKGGEGDRCLSGNHIKRGERSCLFRRENGEDKKNTLVVRGEVNAKKEGKKTLS